MVCCPAPKQSIEILIYIEMKLIYYTKLMNSVDITFTMLLSIAGYQWEHSGAVS